MPATPQNDAAPRVAYTNARLLDPASGLDAPGALLIEDGRIADLGPRLFHDAPPGDAKVVDCAGACLAPGLIDMRAQLGEPGQEHKETIRSAGRAAASAGITSLACLPNTDPVIDDVAGLEFIARRAREAKSVKVYAYGSITRGTTAVANAQMMRRALSYSTAFETVLVQHPAEPTLATGVMNSGALATRLGLTGNPAMAEVILVERDLRLVEMTGGRYHVGHVSAAETVEVIRRAKARGLPVTCDTAPHYFTLTEDAVGDYRTFAKVSPPLRREADRAAVAAGVADGTIDAVASDHCPQDQDAKRLPFAAAGDGIAGLETLFALSLALVHQGRLGLLDLLARLTSRPAGILGLEAGRLAKGAPADLVVFDPDAAWTIDPDAFLGKCKNAPYEDHPVKGRVLRTVVDGRPLFVADGAGGPR